jgi:hypothetical protein
LAVVFAEDVVRGDRLEHVSRAHRLVFFIRVDVLTDVDGFHLHLFVLRLDPLVVQVPSRFVCIDSYAWHVYHGQVPSDQGVHLSSVAFQMFLLLQLNLIEKSFLPDGKLLLGLADTCEAAQVLAVDASESKLDLRETWAMHDIGTDSVGSV